MLVKTDAIVLKAAKFRDTSKIVTFYTRRYGKLKGIAKGARQIKSKFGAALEPITNVSLVLYKKEHRDLQLVSQCDIVRTYKRIHSELERMTVALSIIELVNQLAREEEENLPLYTLLVDALDEVERASKNAINLFYAFAVRLAGLFGFAPALNACGQCGRDLDDFALEGSVLFQLSRGAILCPRCGNLLRREVDGRGTLSRQRPSRSKVPAMTESSVRVSVPVVKIIQRLFTAKLASLPGIEFSRAVGNEIDATLRLYLRQHFEDLKPLKSLEIYKQTSGEVSARQMRDNYKRRTED